jgi:hypothetical protein
MNFISEISDGPNPPASVMEGNGFYNKYAAIPAAGGALTLPLLEEAARLTPEEQRRTDDPLLHRGRTLAGAW